MLNWAPPLVYAANYRQFLLDRPCPVCNAGWIGRSAAGTLTETERRIRQDLPVLIWVQGTGGRTPCGEPELLAHPASVRRWQAAYGGRRCDVWICASSGRFVE